jgi:hypothetical protein
MSKRAKGKSVMTTGAGAGIGPGGGAQVCA